MPRDRLELFKKGGAHAFRFLDKIERLSHDATI